MEQGYQAYILQYLHQTRFEVAKDFLKTSSPIATEIGLMGNIIVSQYSMKPSRSMTTKFKEQQ